MTNLSVSVASNSPAILIIPALIDTTPVSPLQYQSNQGSLVFLLPIRHDIKKEAVFLCSKNSNPTRSDQLHQTHLLRYLKGTAYLGPTYSANPLHFPNGVQVTSEAKSSHACHTDGSSHSVYLFRIGNVNAPFFTFSAKESTTLAASPHEAEYITLGRCAKTCVYFRQFATDLGFPQTEPTPIKEDNIPAIFLAITRKSRHIFIKHHYIRWLWQNKIINPIYANTHDVIADGMTKYQSPAPFLYFRSKLLNYA